MKTVYHLKHFIFVLPYIEVTKYPNIHTLKSIEDAHSNIANRVPSILKKGVMGKNKASCKNIGTDSKE